MINYSFDVRMYRGHLGVIPYSLHSFKHLVSMPYVI